MNKSYAERIEDGEKARANHKALLAADEVLIGHPKLDRLYELAWEHGHAAGWSEVEMYFHEFATLLTR